MRQLPIFLCDYYKLCHADQYDERINKLVSYSTPRGCRLPGKSYVINFGIQAFCKKYLIEIFNEEFFKVPRRDIERITRIFLTNTLPGINIEKSVERIMKLHELGYLPISIRTLPEGSKVSLKCPNVELVTTHPDFPWIGGYIESLFSSNSWKPMLDATVGHWYREVADRYYEMTVDNWQFKVRSAMSEFGFRGADSPESGIGSGAAWLLSFNKTATCSAIPYINKYYNTVYPDNTYDISEYVDRYREDLLEKGDKKKLEDVVGNFMKSNKNWHGISSMNRKTGEWETGLPLGHEEYPYWLLPRDVWFSGKDFIIGNYKVTNDGNCNYYLTLIDKDIVGQGLISTEHSVMCSGVSLEMEKGFSQEDAERNVVERLLTEVYPHSSFSMVSDSYDYWRLIDYILPRLKKIILSRSKEDGSPATLFVRGDSGDPVKIIAGYMNLTDLLTKEDVDKLTSDDSLDNYISEASEKYPDIPFHILPNYGLYVRKDSNNFVVYYNNFSNELVFSGRLVPDFIAEGTVEILWDIFGGEVNSKGYKVLDPHIRAIYGDSITHQRQESIYRLLMMKGFSVENVSLGAGSFSFHAYEDKNETLYPYTRDTYNFAMKATYGETDDDKSILIYKDPKTDSDKFKKSMRGCCAVYKCKDEDNMYYLDHDGLTLEKRESDADIAFEEIFRDGKMTKEVTFRMIRDVLNNENF